ncbi:hypothetical protein [Sphingomonas sp. Leaf25]|uniref:hypothetical protein n=1 Tax=Sphingomonas sp. Leaf25 TaxID=1735692 RepID=UPI0006FB1FB0|nr:hypothetical protein [Sphingomonas sp. Leaf25]KQN00565.1 hypothetical protein ASE78_05630 [Sphingomonas sp. Leaf25]
MTSPRIGAALLANSALATAGKIDLPPATVTADVTAPAELLSYKVAPGRTVDLHQPGDDVELSATDAKRLFDLGFILDGDGSLAVFTEGPKVVAGAEIKER